MCIFLAISVFASAQEVHLVWLRSVNRFQNRPDRDSHHTISSIRSNVSHDFPSVGFLRPLAGLDFTCHRVSAYSLTLSLASFAVMNARISSAMSRILSHCSL
jgi:hypothetical protein